MVDQTLQALVVDDEPAVRLLVSQALRRSGFRCDIASDGLEAEKRAVAQQYDVVITDLRMPNQHGYALAENLLSWEHRPVIIVHTGVLEPRLATTLLSQGVDDILFKPTDFSFLAAKAKTLVTRRSELLRKSSPQPATPHGSLRAGELITLRELQAKVASMSRMMPFSKAAIEVYNMVSNGSHEVHEIAAAMHGDASLIAEILRLANSSVYNAAGEQISSLEKAIVRVGQKRVGELALATNALAAMTTAVLPWLNVELTWKRSLAAGLAMERIAALNPQHHTECVTLTAIMHPLGRVLLGTLYPRKYEEMIAACREDGESLQSKELRVFPVMPSEVTAQLLSDWNIPAPVFLPLKYATEDYASIALLAEPLRTQTEMVKCAILIGWLAATEWEDWDQVEFPSTAVLRRLRIQRIDDIVGQVQQELRKLGNVGAADVKSNPSTTSTAGQPAESVGYCKLANEDQGLVSLILPSMGLLPKHVARELWAKEKLPLIVDCLETDAMRFAEYRGDNERITVVCHPGEEESFSKLSVTVALPTSYRQLKTACRAKLEN